MNLKTVDILIVDDEPINIHTVANLLDENYNISIATNAKSALDIINEKNTPFHIILLDINMPNMNGFELTEKICEDKKNKDSHIIFFSADDSADYIQKGIDLGASDYITKPIEPKKFLLKISFWTKLIIQTTENKKNTQLLEQYKNTVDRSSIVSKADAKGIITYVNEAFCEISGYSKEELLGNPHNIVRHPDMDSSVFKEMWHCIKDSKKPWMGKIKNRKKDGSDYWVQTIINPILDKDNNVLEYIGIRTDVTEIEQMKEHLKKQYDITQGNFNEVMNLSKLYEKAMDQSSIILRANTDKIITYANDLFYEISGYTEEELIGKPYSYIKTDSTIKTSYIDEIIESLQDKKVWKGQIRNIFKDGKIHYFLATVVPIINLKGEILEYMSIRQDITEIVELHQEMEETQREIIYKMGEIGESRSNETGNHVKRVAEYSKLLGQLYGLDDKQAEILFTASPMHDIGKVGIPDSILNKPGKLTDEEWEVMRTHSTIGYDILKNSKREVLQAAGIVARDHHEKWDGSGYPRNIKGEDIHIYGRITAIADVFDALGSHRCYKEAWEDEKIFQLLKDQKAKHFDPVLIDLFFDNLDKFKAIRDRYTD
ncbi:MAG: PAS domain S-box protein [Poseidonibacter sp.]|uniref:PAS domain S-box protein n=1 Tax=Poseidonibacter sp. TaxID=2321188 RepID=UPI00359D4577